MSLLIIRLITFLNGQPRNTTNYHIASVMIHHYSTLHSSSIDEIAKLCAVSKSTISKFARTLGFDDYYDLKDNATLIEDRFNNPLNYLTNIVTGIQETGIDNYFDAITKDIQYLREHLDMTAINRVALALLNHQNVYAFGLVFSESAAIDFQYKLAYAGKFIQTFPDDLVQEDCLRQADEDTLIIIFSNSGDYMVKQQIRTGTPIKDAFLHTKAKIMVITSNQRVAQLPFVAETVVFPHQTNYQTHTVMYQIITDMIVTKYRQLLPFQKNS